MYLYANVSGEYYDALPEGITTSNSLLNILLDILWIRGVSGTNAHKNCLHYTIPKIEDGLGSSLGQILWRTWLISGADPSVCSLHRCQRKKMPAISILFRRTEYQTRKHHDFQMLNMILRSYVSTHDGSLVFCTYCQITGPDMYSSFSSHCSIPTGKLLYIPLTL